MKADKLIRAMKLIKNNLIFKNGLRDFLMSRILIRFDCGYISIMSYSDVSLIKYMIEGHFPQFDSLRNKVVIVDGRDFLDILKNLKDLDFEIKFNDLDERTDSETISFISESATFVLACHKSDTYPIEQPFDKCKEFSIDKDVFVNALKKLTPLQSTNKDRQILMNIAMIITKNELKFAATDGRKLGEIYIDTKFKSTVLDKENKLEIHIPGKICKTLLSNVDIMINKIWFMVKDGKCSIYLNDRVYLQFRYDNNYEYPKTEKAFPEGFTQRIIVNRKEFLNNIKMIDSALMRNNQPKKMIMKLVNLEEKQAITFESGYSKDGYSSSSMDVTECCKQEFANLTIGFNSTYMKQMLEALNYKEIILELNDNLSPVVIKDAQSNKRERFLLMPLRG